jgi:hypothetical protein
MRKIINGQESLDRHYDFFNFTPERQRLEFYTNTSAYNALYTFTYEDDTKLCLGKEARTIRFNNGKGWSQVRDPKGFTYDKTTKKFKFWYKTVPREFTDYEWQTILQETGNEWLEQIFYPITSLVTATMLGKVFSKKITNPIDFCKLFIKSKPWLKNSDMSPAQLHKLLVTMKCNGDLLGRFIPLFSVAKSVTPLVDMYIKGDRYHQHHVVEDLTKQCLALDKKVDFSWSSKRLNEYHTELTREIMQYKIHNIRDTRVEYTKIPGITNSIKLLSSEKEIFEEGTLMHHCVYTNYWSQVSNRIYFVFTYENGDVRATVGVNKHWESDRFQVSQMYQKFNQSVPEEDRARVKSIMDSDAMQEWFEQNSKKEKLPEMEEIVDFLGW